MKPFEFHAELFEFRSSVLETLSDNGFAWLSEFGAIDPLHDVYGLEVTAIREESDAVAITGILRKMFPDWRYHRTYYKDHSSREAGWKVVISRDPEEVNDDWQRVN
jgi:hypothetical protein